MYFTLLLAKDHAPPVLAINRYCQAQTDVTVHQTGSVFLGSRDGRIANTLGRRCRVFVVDDGCEEPLTTEHNMDKVEQIFDQLDDWRHLPTYQLERRADIFFSLYLREILESFTGTEIHEIVIPEFPLRKETLRKARSLREWLGNPAGRQDTA